MATRIPLPGDFGEAFRGGVDTGGTLFQRMIQPVVQKQQLEQQWQQHLRNAAIREQQEARLRELQPYLIGEYKNKAEAQPFNMDLLKAKIQSEQERAKMMSKGGNQRITAAIQEADALFDRDDPRYTQYILNKNKQYMPTEQQVMQDEQLKSSPEYEKMAPYLENAVDMNSMPVQSQNYYRKQMNDELSLIDKGKQVKHAISQAREIVKDNPDLYRKAINIIANPDATPGKIEKALTAFMPEKDVNAFAGLGKLYADILTKQAQLNNMSRSVYALKLQQQAKAQVKNPDEVNEQIFKNIEREIAPSLDREKAILHALKRNQYLPFTKNYNFDEGDANQVPNEVHSQTPMGMMKGVINGQEVNLHPSKRAQFEKKGGKIL